MFNAHSVWYGIQQGMGQLTILSNTIPIEQLENDPLVEDSVKQKLRLIKKVKIFAETFLGLTPTKNYSSYYDQKGKPVLWVVTASPEFKIEAKEWCFSVAGCFPYKGYFDLKKAQKEEHKMKQQGYDTEIGEVSAWSTLGWFKDPILSSMLDRSDGRLAELIIHESTHSTLYVKDDVQFNENLASFFGRKGAELFLMEEYGENSDELEAYRTGLDRSSLFRDYMRSAIANLDSLYSQMNPSWSLEEKRKQKEQWIEELKLGLLSIGYYSNEAEGRERLKNFEPNNAYFSGLSTYSKELPTLEKKLEEEYKGNLRAMIQAFQRKYKSL